MLLKRKMLLKKQKKNLKKKREEETHISNGELMELVVRELLLLDLKLVN